MVLQTNAKNAKGRRGKHQAFDVFVKRHALKILIDYKDATGRKWASILQEIEAVTGVHAGMISRQNLESWERGGGIRDIITDAKFGWVYKFLTHPETLARPELAHAAMLFEPFHALLRRGRVFAEFIGRVEDSAFFREIGSGVTEGDIRTSPNFAAVCGTYLGGIENDAVFLSLQRLNEENFLVAHLLRRPFDAGSFRHGAFRRSSGFAVFGTAMYVFVKDILTKETEVFEVFLRRIKDKAVEELMSTTSGARRLYGAVVSKMMSKEQHTEIQKDYVREGIPIIYRRVPEEILEGILDEFRWRVPE